MQLELTEKEFKKLREMAFIGQWVINGDGRNQDELAMNVLDKILGQSKEKKWQTLSQEVTQDMAERYISPYEEEVFTNHLSEEMALYKIEEAGIDLERLSPEQQLATLEKYTEMAMRELTDNF